jgi:hypothetical protein
MLGGFVCVGVALNGFFLNLQTAAGEFLLKGAVHV